jgi:hypothetical protein
MILRRMTNLGECVTGMHRTHPGLLRQKGKHMCRSTRRQRAAAADSQKSAPCGLPKQPGLQPIWEAFG